MAALAAAATLGLPAPSDAEPLAVSNAGFEELYLGSNLPPEYGGDPPTGSCPTARLRAGRPGTRTAAPRAGCEVGDIASCAGVDGLEVDFDHMRLDSVPVGFVPASRLGLPLGRHAASPNAR